MIETKPRGSAETTPSASSHSASDDDVAGGWLANGSARPTRRTAQTLPTGLILSIPLLADLGPEHALALVRHGIKRRFQRGELVVRQGQCCTSLYILLHGQAHVLISGVQGREVILEVLKPGDHVGDMSLIDNQPLTSSVRCIQPCDVLELDGSELARALPQQPLLSLALMRGLTRRLRSARRQITSLALFDVSERVLRRLADLAVPRGPDRHMVCEHLSRIDLAKMVGASREMTSRALRELELRGWIESLPDGGLWLKRPPPG